MDIGFGDRYISISSTVVNIYFSVAPCSHNFFSLTGILERTSTWKTIPYKVSYLVVVHLDQIQILSCVN